VAVVVKTKGKRGYVELPSTTPRTTVSKQLIEESEQKRNQQQADFAATIVKPKSKKDLQKEQARRAYYSRKSNRILRKAKLLKNTTNIAKSACVAWGNNFYRLPRWRRLREKALKLYGEQCHKCKATENLHVDHIRCRKYHPELAFHMTNLQILCEECNTKKGTHHSTDYRPSEHRILAERAVGIRKRK
jgi:5-methylcytosine-specific restriction endonuclease McrA